VTKGSTETSARIIGSMIDYTWAAESSRNSARLIRRMADPTTKIVTMTVTEKGYNCDLATRDLIMEDPANAWISESKSPLVRLVNGKAPVTSALGYITGALSLIKAQDKEPFTVLSCDNL